MRMEPSITLYKSPLKSKIRTSEHCKEAWRILLVQIYNIETTFKNEL